MTGALVSFCAMTSMGSLIPSGCTARSTSARVQVQRGLRVLEMAMKKENILKVVKPRELKVTGGGTKTVVTDAATAAAASSRPR